MLGNYLSELRIYRLFYTVFSTDYRGAIKIC